jgi:hypothetical protein
VERGIFFCWVSPIIIALIAIALPPLPSPPHNSQFLSEF